MARNRSAMHVTRHQHESSDAEDGAGRTGRGRIGHSHRNKRASYTRRHVKKSKAAVAINTFEKRTKNVDRVIVKGKMHQANVQKHRHDQPPVFTAISVGPVRSAEIEQQVGIGTKSRKSAQKEVRERWVGR